MGRGLHAGRAQPEGASGHPRILLALRTRRAVERVGSVGREELSRADDGRGALRPRGCRGVHLHDSADGPLGAEVRPANPPRGELRLSASEFLDRVALFIRLPRKHRHHYFGVLAPNSPWPVQLVAQAWRKLEAGRKPPRSKVADADSGAKRTDIQLDICGHICWCAFTGCLRLSAAGGCAWLPSSQSQ